MTRVILVQGATGQTGSFIVRHLSQLKSADLVVRAGFRDAKKAESLKGLAGVELVHFDIEDPSTHGELKRGVDTVVIVPASTENRGLLAAKLALAVKNAGSVRRIVMLSVLNADKGEYLFGRQFTEAEKTVEESGLDYSIVRFPFFTSNFGYVNSMKGQDKVDLYNPFPKDATFPSIDLDDLGEVFAKVIGSANGQQHSKKVYSAYGEVVTGDQAASAIGKVIGKPTTWIEVPDEAADKALSGMGVPQWQATGIVELWRYYAKGRGNVENAFKTIVGRDPISFEHSMRKLLG